MDSNKGKVMTVTGLIDPPYVGNTSTHDHVIIDFNAILTEPMNKEEIYLMDQKIDINIYIYFLVHQIYFFFIHWFS